MVLKDLINPASIQLKVTNMAGFARPLLRVVIGIESGYETR